MKNTIACSHVHWRWYDDMAISVGYIYYVINRTVNVINISLSLQRNMLFRYTYLVEALFLYLNKTNKLCVIF